MQSYLVAWLFWIELNSSSTGTLYWQLVIKDPLLDPYETSKATVEFSAISYKRYTYLISIVPTLITPNIRLSQVKSP